MGTTIVARFADGRLLVEEKTLATTHYTSGGYWLRIGHVKTVEKVLSVTTDFEKVGLITDLGDVAISGDKVKVIMRRGDLSVPVISGSSFASGYPVHELASGLAVSGNPYRGELFSGLISGYVTITANVIAI